MKGKEVFTCTCQFKFVWRVLLSIGTKGKGAKCRCIRHTHTGRCCPCALLRVSRAGVKCFVPACQPLWAIYRHGDMSAFICESLSSFCVCLSLPDHFCHVCTHDIHFVHPSNFRILRIDLTHKIADPKNNTANIQISSRIWITDILHLGVLVLQHLI